MRYAESRSAATLTSGKPTPKPTRQELIDLLRIAADEMEASAVFRDSYILRCIRETLGAV